MKLNSKYFDSIRVKPGKKGEPQQQREDTGCDWPGCTNTGTYPAPKGRGREGEYFHFCMSHVRQYNKDYNFFKGMSDDEAAQFRDGIPTGHRPTWAFSSNGSSEKRRAVDADQWGLNGTRTGTGFAGKLSERDIHGVLGAGSGGRSDVKPARRVVHRLERKCLVQMNLDVNASSGEIKARFKELVKRHHPDSSGGEGSEEKLREVIQAYNYLKKAGFC